jgi:hypothetical protein
LKIGLFTGKWSKIIQLIFIGIHSIQLVPWQGHTSCENRGRPWSGIRQGEGGNINPPYKHINLELLASRAVTKINFCGLTDLVVLHYGHPRKLIWFMHNCLLFLYFCISIICLPLNSIVL